MAASVSEAVTSSAESVPLVTNRASLNAAVFSL
jgi:hypothetical protein